MFAAGLDDQVTHPVLFVNMSNDSFDAGVYHTKNDEVFPGSAIFFF